MIDALGSALAIGAVGGLIGGVIATVAVIVVRAVLKPKCPRCSAPLPLRRKVRPTFRQMMLGGVTCGRCGAESGGLGGERIPD